MCFLLPELIYGQLFNGKLDQSYLWKLQLEFRWYILTLSIAFSSNIFMETGQLHNISVNAHVFSSTPNVLIILVLAIWTQLIWFETDKMLFQRTAFCIRIHLRRLGQYFIDVAPLFFRNSIKTNKQTNFFSVMLHF